MIGVIALCMALTAALLFLLASLAEQHVGNAGRWIDSTYRSAIGQPPRPDEPPSPHGPIPYGTPGAWFSVDSYPVAAQRRGEQGRTVATLHIGRDGRLRSCTIAVSSGSAALDAATCRVATSHAEFLPAKNRSGDPIDSAWPLPVRWVLPQQ